MSEVVQWIAIIGLIGVCVIQHKHLAINNEAIDVINGILKRLV